MSVKVPPMSAARRRLGLLVLDGGAFMSWLLEFRRTCFPGGQARTGSAPAGGAAARGEYRGCAGMSPATTGGRVVPVSISKLGAAWRDDPPHRLKHRKNLIFSGKKYLIAAGTNGSLSRLAGQVVFRPGAPRGRAHGRMNRSQENYPPPVWEIPAPMDGRGSVRIRRAAPGPCRARAASPRRTSSIPEFQSATSLPYEFKDRSGVMLSS